MAAPGTNQGYNAKNIAASTAVNSNFGQLGGIFVSAASSTPTITVYDGASASGTKIIDTFTPVAATYYTLPAVYGTGLYVAISGTVSCTVFYL